MPVVKPEKMYNVRVTSWSIAMYCELRRLALSLSLSACISVTYIPTYIHNYTYNIFIYIYTQIIIIYTYVFLCARCLAKVGFYRCFFQCRNPKKCSLWWTTWKNTICLTDMQREHSLNPPVQELQWNQNQSVGPIPKKIHDLCSHFQFLLSAKA